MSNSLPEVTHLQFVILSALSDADQSGRDLRELLATHGVRNSAPAFYQMMSRLESSGLVEGWYEQMLVDGQNIKERRYALRKPGERALADTRNFYQAKIAPRRRKAHA